MDTLCKPIKYRCLNTGDTHHQQALTLRYTLFFEPHGLPRDILYDEDEENSVHLAAIIENKVAAYGRLTIRQGGTAQISQMVVSPTFQRQGLGYSILEKLVEKAKCRDVNQIMLHARLNAATLYRKLGFISVSDVYCSPKTGINHITMKLEIKKG